MRFINQSANYVVLRSLENKDEILLSTLHAACFSLCWIAEDFSLLLSDKRVFGFVGHLRDNNQASAGFILARVGSEKAEILTMGVLPKYRRKGIGWLLMHEILRELHACNGRGVLFLEVDDTNSGARALYKRMNFYQIGKREREYQLKKSKIRTSVLIMKRDF